MEELIKKRIAELEGNRFLAYKKRNEVIKITSYQKLTKEIETYNELINNQLSVLESYKRLERGKCVKIINQTSDENVRKACEIVIKHFKDDAFLKRVKEIDSFNYTNDPGIVVAHRIQCFDGEVIIRSYRPWFRWSKAIGYEKNGIIYINEYIKLPILDRVENLYHEICHKIGYSHKGNYVNEFNLQTVPYMVGNMFKNYIKEIYQDIAA